MRALKLQLDSIEAERILGDLARELQNGRRFKKVVVRAQNRVLMGMRTEVVKDVRSEYRAPAAEIRRGMSVRRASTRDMTARLTVKGRMSIELVNFSARETRRGVSVRVLRRSRAAVIRPGGSQGILATKKRQVSATFIAKGHVLARVKDKDHPIILWGPNFMSAFSKPELRAQLQREAERRFAERLHAEANHELAKLRGAR